MYPILLHIYGPFNINSYGVAIVIGIILFIKYAFNDPIRRSIMTDKQFFDTIQGSVLVGVIAAKVLDIIAAPEQYQSFYDIIAFWHGGFSLLGAVVGISLFLIYQLLSKNIPLLPFLDICAIYAPLLQAFGRIGCFFAGCCYGVTTQLPWAITYTHPEAQAPLCVPLHPTQLYSAFILFLFFVGMHYLKQARGILKPGILFGIYLFFMSGERFLIDFWRAERYMITRFLSFHQVIALLLLSIATGLVLVLIYYWLRHNKNRTIGV